MNVPSPAGHLRGCAPRLSRASRCTRWRAARLRGALPHIRFGRLVSATRPRNWCVSVLLACLATNALGAAPATAATPLAVREAAAPGGNVLALPSSRHALTGRIEHDGIAIEISADADVLSYRAVRQDRTARAHAHLAGPPMYFAFDPHAFEFRRLASLVRVEVDDYGALEALVQALGAVSAKAYPELGFALIRLHREADPAQAAQHLTALPNVRAATVQFKNQAHRPRPPRPRLPNRGGAEGDLPAARSGLKADLHVFFDGLRSAADGALTATITILNWGAASSRAARLQMHVATEPTFANVVATRNANIPALAPKDNYVAALPIDTADLADATYYVLAYTPTQSAELGGRGYTNEDVAGFTLDAAGRIRLECHAAGYGGQTGVADPLYRQQWHLNNTGQRAYSDSSGSPNADLSLNRILSRGPTGAGVRVAVVDTGLETCHPDLAARVEIDASFNFNAGLAGTSSTAASWHGARPDDPFNPSSAGDHGTSVAGLLAAESRNGSGGRGVAPGVLLRGYNMLSAMDWDLGVYLDALGASHFAPDSSSVDVFNMSFGSLGEPRNIGSEAEALFAFGARRLRGGLGAVYVKAAGNGFGSCAARSPSPLAQQVGCSSANGDATNNIPYVIVVGGLTAEGERASYASAGANLWVSAPAGEDGRAQPAMLTTDQVGRAVGYGVVYGDRLSALTDLNPNHDHTSSFNGTSSAAPNVSGVVAVLLEAVPTLTWREVKHVLASTARRTHRHIAAVERIFGGTSRVVRRPWTRNGAGYSFHNWYGFGAARADGALEAARSLAPGSLGAFRRSGWFDAGAASTPIPDNAGEGIAQTRRIAGLPTFANIEAVMVEVDLDHPFPHDLGIELRSPSGTRSILNPVFNEVLAIDRSGDPPLRWRLLSNAFYGEAPNGNWTLTVFDGAAGETGALAGWRMRFYYGDHQEPPGDD